MKNPFDHPPNPLPDQEGGGNCIWGDTPKPLPKGQSPSGLPFFSNLLGFGLTASGHGVIIMVKGNKERGVLHCGLKMGNYGVYG